MPDPELPKPMQQQEVVGGYAFPWPYIPTEAEVAQATEFVTRPEFQFMDADKREKVLCRIAICMAAVKAQDLVPNEGDDESRGFDVFDGGSRVVVQSQRLDGQIVHQLSVARQTPGGDA